MSHRIVLVLECDSDADMQTCKRIIENSETLEEYGTMAMVNGPTDQIRAMDVQRMADKIFGQVVKKQSRKIHKNPARNR